MLGNTNPFTTTSTIFLYWPHLVHPAGEGKVVEGFNTHSIPTNLGSCPNPGQEVIWRRAAAHTWPAFSHFLSLPSLLGSLFRGTRSLYLPFFLLSLIPRESSPDPPDPYHDILPTCLPLFGPSSEGAGYIPM